MLSQYRKLKKAEDRKRMGGLTERERESLKKKITFLKKSYSLFTFLKILVTRMRVGVNKRFGWILALYSKEYVIQIQSILR